MKDNLARTWGAARTATAEQQEQAREYEKEKLRQFSLHEGDWAFKLNLTLKNTSKRGKLYLPQCGPYRIIELSNQTRMAKLEVKGGKDKWVH